MKWPPHSSPLKGSIVTLEPISADHRDGLRAASREDETWTWLGRDVPGSDEAFSRWFDERLEASQAREEWCFVTRSIEGGRPIGSSSYLHVRVEHDGLEIGWTWLHPSAWRTGANVEAKLLMLTEAFDELACMRVEFKTDARNDRSRAALEALPAMFEGVFRQHMLIPGVGRRDSAYYSIVDSEWPEVRANLEWRLAREPARA
jgi:N-acetyltransferase